MKYKSKVLTINVPTKSGKIYSRDILEREVSRIQESIKSRSLMGELGEPTESIIKFANVSHIVTEAKIEGDDLIVEIEILKTPFGKLLKNFIDQNVKISLNVCGVGGGDLNEDGNLEIGDNFKLITFHVGGNDVL